MLYVKKCISNYILQGTFFKPYLYYIYTYLLTVPGKLRPKLFKLKVTELSLPGSIELDRE